MTSTSLVAIAGGRVYHDYALALMESAREHFHPTGHTSYLVLDGEDGWPAGTITRWRTLLAAMPPTDYIFLSDCDMLVAQEVGAEVLPGPFGITATLHPGYVGKPERELPFETNPEGAAFGFRSSRYFCGGFVGGQRRSMLALGHGIEHLRLRDEERGIVSRWHDETYLNACLSIFEPMKILSPAYAHPDDDSYYRQSVWQEEYPRTIIALDKPTEARQGR